MLTVVGLAMLAAVPVLLIGFAAGAAYGGRHAAAQSHRADLAEDNVATLRHRLGERRAVEDMLAGDVTQLRRALAAERAGRAAGR
jgi:L-fucose isomerase-like protein